MSRFEVLGWWDGSVVDWLSAAAALCVAALAGVAIVKGWRSETVKRMLSRAKNYWGSLTPPPKEKRELGTRRAPSPPLRARNRTGRDRSLPEHVSSNTKPRKPKTEPPAIAEGKNR